MKTRDLLALAPLLAFAEFDYMPDIRPSANRRRGSSGVRMGAHNRLMAIRRHRSNKIARKSRRINRSGK